MSAPIIFSNSLSTQLGDFQINNHDPSKFTDKKRRELKNAFRLAINKSRTREEAVRLTKLRTKFFSPGGLSEDDAILAWLEVSLMNKAPTKQADKKNGRFCVRAG